MLTAREAAAAREAVAAREALVFAPLCLLGNRFLNSTLCRFAVGHIINDGGSHIAIANIAIDYQL